MDSLQVRTGQVSLRILDDSGEERGIFRFNPEDVESAKKVLSLQEELTIKNEEFIKRNSECKTADERIALLSETVTYFRGLIDNCFGEGTSDLVFGNAHTLSMFSDFIEGITPYYTEASAKRTAKYKKSAKK